MKFLITAVMFALTLSAWSVARADYEYVCLQPDDVAYTTVPAVEWDASYPMLQSEYAARDLFRLQPGRVDVFRFSPHPRIEIVMYAEDYENEVLFDRVRFLIAEGRLYTWIGFTANHTGGVAHRVVRSLIVDGKEVARSRPMTIDVRANLRDCN